MNTTATGRTLLATLGLIGIPTAALGADPAARAELTPLIGYRSGGSFQDSVDGTSLDLDEGANQALIFNLDHDANTQWEIVYSRQDSQLDLLRPFQGRTQVDVDVHQFSVGGIYVFRDAHPGVVPFLGAGIGVTRLSPDGLDHETRPLLGFTAGYKFFFADNIGARIEARAYGTAMETDTAIFCGDGACLARVDSDGFWQYELNAGITLRF